MQTGYTSILFDKPETTFAEFAQRCARAFGAMAHMRDMPMDAPTERPKVPDFYLENVRHNGAKLAELCALGVNDVEDRFRRAQAAARGRNETQAAETENQLRTIVGMNELVMSWPPPTSAHAELKRFMLDQLRMSRPGEPFKEQVPHGSPLAWWTAEILSATEDLRRSVQECDKARDAASINGRWVSELLESVGVAKVAP